MRAALPQVETIPLTLRSPRNARGALRLAQILRTRRVDILHSHLFFASLFASPVGWCCGVPLIIETPHVAERWRSGLKARFLVDRVVGRTVDRYIAVSEANRLYLVDEKGLPADKTTVIHNGCDLRRFEGSGTAANSLKARLGFPPDAPVLLAVGRLEPQKGHRVLLEAFARLGEAFPDLRLVCVGEGSLRSDLAETARGLRVGEKVCFVGRQSNVQDWYAMADITVLPSFYEGLPLAAIESLAAGRAVVATAVDGTPEVVVHESTGLTVPPGDPAALSESIRRLLADPGLRSRLANNGRAWVRERFSDEQQIRKTENLYLECMERRRRGDEPQAVRAISSRGAS